MYLFGYDRPMKKTSKILYNTAMFGRGKEKIERDLRRGLADGRRMRTQEAERLGQDLVEHARYQAGRGFPHYALDALSARHQYEDKLTRKGAREAADILAIGWRNSARRDREQGLDDPTRYSERRAAHYERIAHPFRSRMPRLPIFRGQRRS